MAALAALGDLVAVAPIDGDHGFRARECPKPIGNKSYIFVRESTVATFIRGQGEDIEVCVEMDGFRLCGFVSSMHLVANKEAQIKRAIEHQARQILRDAAQAPGSSEQGAESA